jgi:hypothetical protein
MRRFHIAFLGLMLGVTLLDAQSSIKRLQDVRTIYVAPMGIDNREVCDLINAKLITYLAKHRGIFVVETLDEADAVLTGTGQVRTTTQNGLTFYHIQGAMRLDNKDGRVLWADDVSSSLFARSASSSFAENVAKRLVEAIVGKTDKTEKAERK